MNSLQNLSVIGKRAFFALMIISSIALNVAAQNVQPQQQGRMYGDPNFRGEPINLNVVNADIRDILNYITEQYGINFVIDGSVPKSVPVTVNLNNVPWNVALDSILQANDLAVQVNGPILRIVEAKKLAAELEVQRRNEEGKLDTSPLYTEIIRLNYARVSGTLSGTAGGGGAFTGGVVPGQPATSGGGGGGADQGILGIIKRRLSRRGAIEVDGRTNTLIITDVRQNIDAVRQLVVLLDQPEPQVEIETRIVIAQRNFLREIGVQLGLNVNSPFNRGGVLGIQTGRPSDNVPTGSFFLTTGVFGTGQITAALNLAETKGQSKTIATPRVTALNNRQAEIESGSQIPVTTVQRNAGGDDEEDGVVFTTTFVNVPLRLSVTPQITDAGTVILKVVAENNTVNPALSSGLGGVPGIDTQRMQTEVLVPDGGTTVVGGVLSDLEVVSKSKTPGLGSVPIIKYLFRNKATQRNTAEILFFITPRIYRPDYEGNPTAGKIGTGNRSTTIIQPVPLGNPPSNSDPVPTQTPAPQPIIVPVVPNVSPAENNPSNSTTTTTNKP